MSKKKEYFTDITKRLTEISISFLEGVLIVKKRPSIESIDSAKRVIKMAIDTLKELEDALDGGN